MNSDFMIVFFNIVFSIGLWWLYFVEYKSYRVDMVRQRLFKIRDELFYYTAGHNELTFDSKAYSQMRTTANGMIRFAHKVSLIGLVSTAYADKIYNQGQGAKKYEESIDEALIDLSKETGVVIDRMRNNMHLVIVKHIIFSSGVLLTLLFIATIFRVSRKIGKIVIVGNRRYKIKRRWSSIDAAANEIGMRHNANTALI